MAHICEELKIVPEHLTCFEEVGYGSYGVVRKGKWNERGGGITVAIKKVKVNDMGYLKNIISEVEILAKIHHPNILSIYGACFVNQKLWIVTEYVDGGNLYDFLHSCKEITLHDRLKLAHQAAICVNVLHLSMPSIVHRDIKSLNFMVAANRKLKLIDFGFSKQITEVSSHPREAIGTLRWSAPETLKYPPEWSTKADIYSLGMTFYEIASLQVPFQDITEESTLIQTVKNAGRPEIPKECPKKFAKLISLCWDAHQKKRPTSLTLVAKLAKLVESSIGSISCESSSFTSSPPNSCPPSPEPPSLPIPPPQSSTDLQEQKFYLIGHHTFATKFPDLTSPWLMSMYGKHENNSNQLSPPMHPFLRNLTVGISFSGKVTFATKDWSLEVILSNFELNYPTLCHRPGLHLLQDPKKETGISFNNETSRHFFCFSEDTKVKEFSLFFDMYDSKAAFQHDKLSIYDKNSELRLVYFAPILRLSSGKIISPPCKWNSNPPSLSFSIPNSSPPLIVMFGISENMKGRRDVFSLFRFGSIGKIDEKDIAKAKEERKEKAKKLFHGSVD